MLTLPGAGLFAFLTEERTLFSFLLPLKGLRSYEEFLSRLLPRLERVAQDVGQPGLFQNHPILFTKRTDRRIMSSQNEMMYQCLGYFEETSDPFNEAAMAEIENLVNDVPMGLIGLESPRKELAKLCQRPL